MESVLNRKFKQTGLRKTFVAKALNIHHTRLSRIINNKQTGVKVEEIVRISDYLDSVILPPKNKFQKKVK